MYPASGGVQSLGLVAVVEGQRREEQGAEGWVRRRGGESVIWAPPVAQLPSPSGCGSVGVIPGEFSAAASKGLPLSPRAPLEHSYPSKEVFPHLQKLLAEQSPTVPETAHTWALVVSGASELQENRAHYYLVSDPYPVYLLLAPSPSPNSHQQDQGHFYRAYN